MSEELQAEVEETKEVEVEAEEQEAEADQKAETEGETPDDEAEITVSFGGEESPPHDEEPAPEWVRELRKTAREQKKRIKELEAEKAEKASAAKPAELGPKPTLASSDYDEDKFADQLAAWHERKRAVEDAKETQRKASEEAEAKWQARVSHYNDGKTKLKVKDYDDAEDAVKDLLSSTQQGIIVQGADDPALVVYALGRNPQKAKELAQISDPVAFAFAVSKLETTLKVSNRTQKPAPERTIKGAGASSAMGDSQLEKLREEASRTGDFTKVNAYRKKMRAQK